MNEILEKQKNDLFHAKALLYDKLDALEKKYKQDTECIKAAINGVNDAYENICATIQSLSTVGQPIAVSTNVQPSDTQMTHPIVAETVKNVTQAPNFEFTLEDIKPIVQNCCQYPYHMIADEALLKKQLVSMSDTVYDFVLDEVTKHYNADKNNIKAHVDKLVGRV